MRGDHPSEAAVLAGSIAGISGLVVFLLVHHLWIVPIWFIAPVGVVMAGLGGAAVGASYATLRPRLPGRPGTCIAMAAVFAGVLTPALIVAQARGPIFELRADGGGALLVPESDAALDVLVGLVGVCAVSGLALGAVIGRSRRAAGTTMLAAIALAIGPGHNIPLLGGTPAVGKELVILGVVVAVGSTVLVEAEARLVQSMRPLRP